MPPKNYDIIETFFRHMDKSCMICIIGGSMWPPYSTNLNKITHRQAAIDSSMPGEFKKCNQTPQNLHGISNLHTNLQYWQACKILKS